MTTATTCRSFVAVVLTLLAAGTAAHRAPGSLSSIEFNAQSGNTEIIHRLHLHDAELGVSAALAQPSLSLSQVRSRAQVALYVSERFLLQNNGEALKLETIGAEIRGDYLLVYQERKGRLPARVEVLDDILRDAFPRQVNQVNIDDYGTVHTLTFAGEDRWHSYAFSGDEASSGR